MSNEVPLTLTNVTLLLGGVVSVIGILVAVIKGVSWLFSRIKKINEFLDDWAGEPARDGVPERPGVMRRLEAIESQVKPNGGSSMRDEVRSIQRCVQQTNATINSVVYEDSPTGGDSSATRS